MNDTTCPKCGKVLCDKRSLNRHLNRKIPCDYKYVCQRCSKEFKNNRDLNLHLHRKTPCALFTCEHCERHYMDELEYYKHLVDCPAKAKIDQMKMQLELAKCGTNIQNIKNQTINVNVENQYNLVCVFGQEDMKSIDATRVAKMLEGSIGQFLPKMVEYVHADPTKPENNNIVFDPEANKFYLMGQSDVWIEEDPDETMIQLRDNIQKHIQSIQPRILPHITISNKDNCEALLMGRSEYRNMTSETVDRTKKVLENPAKIEKIKASTE